MMRVTHETESLAMSLTESPTYVLVLSKGLELRRRFLTARDPSKTAGF